MMDVVVNEWQRALGNFPQSIIVEAVDRCIRMPGDRWPTPGKIIDLAQEPLRDLREHTLSLDAARRARELGYTGPEMEPPFQPSDDEIAAVSAALAKWRETQTEVKLDRFDEWAPASQGGASEELKRIIRKRDFSLSLPEDADDIV